MKRLNIKDNRWTYQPEIDEFLVEVIKLCKQYQVSITIESECFVITNLRLCHNERLMDAAYRDCALAGGDFDFDEEEPE